jgi:amino acid adenylation domain-containing protein
MQKITMKTSKKRSHSPSDDSVEKIDAITDLLKNWQLRLADAPRLELPTDRLYPAVQSSRADSLSFQLSAELSDALLAVSEHENVSLFTTLLAAFQVLLHRYSGQDDIVIGTTQADQTACSDNVVVLRSDLSGNPSFYKLLARTQAVIQNAFDNAIPFEKLLEILQPQRDLSRHPLFQVLFVFQEMLTDNLPATPTTTPFDLTLKLSKTTHGLDAQIEYATDLFKSATITRLIGHFYTLLAAIVQHPEACLSELPLLTEVEHQQLLVDWNNTAVPLPQYLIHQQFEQQVERAPDAIAVVYQDQQLSYRELNAQANQLAHYLRQLGVKPDVLVGICLERSVNQIIALLAILKAGGAYIPLDTAYPRERLIFILADNTPLVLLTQTKLKALFTDIKATITILELDGPSPAWTNQASNNPDHDNVGLTAENLAYVMYTSGSTGKPKGAGVLHRNLQNQFAWYVHESGLSPKDSVLVVTSYAYALTQRVTFCPLLAGARLVLATEPFDPQAIVTMIAKEQISQINLTASGLHALVTVNNGEFAGLQRVFTAGEPLAINQLLEIPEPRPDFINNYGATECAAAVMYYRVSDNDLERYRNRIMPIGKPIWNCHIYILDQHQQLVPVGVTGEIYIGGYPVGRGYLNRPELTAEFFSKDPFVTDTNARIFKTGDLGRWRADGNIEFLGRKDFQVKIRGFRVELGEIESALRQHPQLQETVVSVYEPIADEKRLVAYLVAQGTTVPTSSELRDFLKPKLPEYMLPSAYVFLDTLPLTPNGKLDRKALPIPDSHRHDQQADFVAPRNPIEALLAEIWANILGIDRVGIHDNFFELGGHSLLAMQVMVHIQKQFNVAIPIHVLFAAPTVAELFEAIQSSDNTAIVMPPITRRADQLFAPLSAAQKGLWFLDKLGGVSSAYNSSQVLRLQGELNRDALEAALKEITCRHAILRTYFIEQEGTPLQAIQSTLPVPISYVDLTHETDEVQVAKIQRPIQIEANLPFDLTRCPLFRVQLWHLAEQHSILQLTFHHIIFDGWSANVFMRELSALYNAFTQGHVTTLPELPIQYGDYALWQQQWLQGDVLEQLFAYWTQQLADIPTLELPTDKARPAIPSFKGQTQRFVLSTELVAKLKELSRREGVTLFMTLLAAFQVLLSRYSGQDDIVVGTPTAGRIRPELEELFGFFVNTLVLRTDTSANPSFIELLGRVRKVALGAYAHQAMPFEKLVEMLRLHRDRNRNPLYQVMFVLQNTADANLQLNDIQADYLQAGTETAKFDLTLELVETPDGLSGRVEYATDLFEAATITRLIGHFQTLLKGIIADPETRLSDLPLLTESERHQLLVEWNNTTVDFPSHYCLHHLFEQQVERTPDTVAIVHEDQQLTYHELNARANQLAHYLRKLGIGSDTLVGICMERSIDMMVGLLGVLKAGGAYVPLDPEYPHQRLAFMVEDSHMAVLLTHGKVANQLPLDAVTIIHLDTDWSTISTESSHNLLTELNPSHLAYTLYTSGSTGRPKGVQISHHAIVNHMLWMQKTYPLLSDDSVLQKTPFSFDASVWEFWAPLTSGAVLSFARTGGQRDPQYLIRTICEQKITTLQVVPTLLEALLAHNEFTNCRSLRRVYAGGEALRPKLLRQFKEALPETSLINLYGPTETTIDATHWYCQYEPTLRTVPIGRPIANTQTYILDRQGQPVPIGVLGELHIGGAGLARGYLNREALTAEKFIRHPFSHDANARLYKTGDLTRYLADGTIEFLERVDHQVKIRGFRIELGEIEQLLAQHPQVKETVVSVYEPSPDDKRLVAYIVAKQGATQNSSELRHFLKEELSEYMLPSAYVFLDTLPLTPNGKLDRKALPIPDSYRHDHQADFVAPRNPVEQQLAEIWGKVLKLKQVGIYDNFFELGGHSLLAVSVVVEAKKRFDLDIVLGTMYQYPTIEEQAKVINSGCQQPAGYSLIPLQTQGSRPPLFVIHTAPLVDLPLYFGKDQPLYFIRYGMAAEINRSVHLPPSLEELASHYIKEMQELQPQGPYYLMGFSFGGIMAYEMARQLADHGQQVNLVALVDTYLEKGIRYLLPLRQIIYKLLKLSPSEFWALVKNKIDFLAESHGNDTDFYPHKYSPGPDKVIRAGYQPKTYHGHRVILFKAQNIEDTTFYRYVSYLEEPWRKQLGDKLELQEIPGEHLSIFTEPYIQIFVDKLMTCMDKVMQAN